MVQMNSMPVFWRLFLGYAAVLSLSLCGFTFAIVRLGDLSQSARAILNTDNQMIGYQERLADAFISEVRYGKKFTVTQGAGYYDQARDFQHETSRYLNELKSLAHSSDIQTLVSRVEQLRFRYNELFEQEVHYIQTKQIYAKSRYQEEKDKLFEVLLTDLERLKIAMQNRLQRQLENVDRDARSTQRIAMVVTFTLFGLALALSVKFTRSISVPLKRLTQRIKNPGASPRSSSYGFSGIPEMQQLFDALEWQKLKCEETVEANANAVDTLTRDLAHQLNSVKKQLTDFLQEAKASGIVGKEISLDSATSTIDGLTHTFVEANASFAAAREVQALRFRTPLTTLESASADEFIAQMRAQGTAAAPHVVKRIRECFAGIHLAARGYWGLFKNPQTKEKGKKC